MLAAMPELPEVEIARRSLTRWMRGARITGARAKDRMVVKGAPAAFARELVGRVVREIERRGKRLRIALDDGSALFAHLGMSGKWVLRAPGDPEEPWERARIDAARRGKRLSVRYVDPRRLGKIVVSDRELPAWRSLGPDPLVDGIDPRHLLAEFARTRRSVKEAVMDQAVLAGVGNIYATEALFLARIDPRSHADALGAADVRALARALAKVLRATIAREERRGKRELTYLHEGRTANPFVVYGRARTPCPRCKRPLQRIVLGGRGTTLCPSCQRRLSRSRVTAGRRARPGR